MIKKLSIILASILVVTLLTGCEIGTVKTEGGNNKMHHVRIEIEKYGTMELELDGETAPITVNNFIKLAKSGYYDGLTFHRNIKGFMAQAGDGALKGKETVPYIKGEFSENGVENNISHERGVISMARIDGYNDSASSQFFIVHKDSKFLDGKYAAFGHVTKGIEVLDEMLENTPVYDDNGGTLPENQPVIKKITVID